MKGKFYKNILFWLGLNFLIHLVFINTPPAEPAHSWRQSLTNMMARNFVQEEAQFIYPEIDIAGENQGIIASEFPLYQFMLSWLYRLFGFKHWCGRLLALIFTTLGIWFFYKCIHKVSKNENLAFLAAWFLIFSLWFSFAWKSMPDIFSVTLAIIAVFYFLEYRDKNHPGFLVLGVLFAMLGVLSKIPAALILSPLVLLVLEKNISVKKKATYVIAGLLVLVPVYIWYGIWVPYLVKTYHFELYFPRSFADGLGEIGSLLPQLLRQFYFQGFSSHLFSVLAISGLAFAILKGRKLPIAIIAIVSLIGSVYIVKTGLVFPTHSYYLIPFVPFLALAAAWFAIEKLTKFPKVFLVILVIGFMECLGLQWNDFFVRDNKKYLYDLEKQCDLFSDRKDKIICNGSPNPQLMFFLNRRGWSLSHDEMLDTLHRKELLQYNPSFVVIDTHRKGYETVLANWAQNGVLVFESKDLKVIKPNHQ